MKEIIDFPMYTLSVDGKVFSKFTEKYLTPVLDSTGYLIVTLCNDSGKVNKSVHRLLAIHFIPNPENKLHVNHIDGVKINNKLGNLEWATVKENTHHAISLGLFRPKSQMTNLRVAKIDPVSGTVLEEFTSLGEASRVCATPQPNITKVCKGKRKTAGGFGWLLL